MRPFVLHYHAESLEETCPLCKTLVTVEAGLQLFHTEQMVPVCASCARRAAPELAALQGLAAEAERVGRINNYNVMPPLTALLELSRAAERFTSTVCPQAVK